MTSLEQYFNEKDTKTHIKEYDIGITFKNLNSPSIKDFEFIDQISNDNIPSTCS
jgi:hypothetical protein